MTFVTGKVDGTKYYCWVSGNEMPATVLIDITGDDRGFAPCDHEQWGYLHRCLGVFGA